MNRVAFGVLWVYAQTAEIFVTARDSFGRRLSKRTLTRLSQLAADSKAKLLI